MPKPQVVTYAKRSGTDPRDAAGPRLRPARLLASTWIAAWLVFIAAPPAHAQALPDGVETVPWICPEREIDDEERARRAAALSPEERARRAEYRRVFPAYVAAVESEPDTELLNPVEGTRVSQIADTWGGARAGNRVHEGQDIFAPEGRPVRSVTAGYVWRIGERALGGKTVTVIGDGARRYYYAHLSAYADIREGQRVTPDTVIGYVGKTGNAAATPPHLHLGVYESWSDGEPCHWEALNPLPLLVDR